jgi:hypothetical protein
LPRREPTERELELRARIQRARDNTWTVVIAGILALIGGVVTILAGLVALGAPLLLVGLVAAVLGERRLSRLGVADRRLLQWGGTDDLPVPGWAWYADENDVSGGGGADYSGGGDGGSDP